MAENLDDFKKQIGAGQLNPDNARSFLTAELDRVLDAGQVAAIGYDSYDLYPKNDPSKAGQLGDHSSVIAARKLIDGQCHYFVRNHFGATCGYRDDLNHLCEKEKGGVWVPIEAVKHLYSVISVR